MNLLTSIVGKKSHNYRIPACFGTSGVNNDGTVTFFKETMPFKGKQKNKNGKHQIRIHCKNAGFYTIPSCCPKTNLLS